MGAATGALGGVRPADGSPWPILEEVRATVDDLAEALDRSVVVEDSRMRLIAFSPQHGKLDAIRERSVLARETPGEAIRWLAELGVFEGHAPMRVAAHPEIGAEARVMAPIRWERELVGFLAVLDPGASLDEAGLDRCDAASRRLSGLLNRMLLLGRGVRPRERELVDALLTGDGATSRMQAGATLVDEGLLHAGRALVLVIEPAGAATDREALLEAIAARSRRAIGPGTVAATTSAGHCALVVSLDGPRDADAQVADTALRVHRSVTTGSRPDVSDPAALLTYGDVVEHWPDAARAYRQARLTAGVARRVGGLGSVVGWAELGAYQVLSLVSASELGGSDADRRLEALLDKPDLVRTLETYLELAGDVKRTAEQLSLHRASLYYRLNRIEELLEIDLKRGDDRLTLHLALKTLRLRGLLA